MLAGRRFVISGLNHLTARVADDLLRRDAEVVVIGDPREDDDAGETADRLAERCRIVPRGYDLDGVLAEAGHVGAAGLLVLGADDMENLRLAAAAHALDPGVPVVLRTFQPELVDEVADELNIRRAYSVAALAAPAFVAAALGEQVVETLRLGDEEVPLCVIDIEPGSPLVGRDPHGVKAGFGCAVIAVARGGDRWRATAETADPLQAHDRVLVGGRQLDVLALAHRNDQGTTGTAGSGAAGLARRRREGGLLAALARPTLLRVGALLFALLLLANVAVNRAVLDATWADALLNALAASVGNPPPPTDSTAVKVFDLLVIGAGVVLPWILLSYITALVLAERLELRMARRAAKMHDHVVLVGLGRVGYRAAQLLVDLGIPTVVMEEETESSSFADAIAVDLPVLRGDGRLPENLERCGIARARCVIACTSDDLANLATCREARRLQPGIRTVLRAFDETVSGRLARAFRIDATLSSTSVASNAFVGAAVDAFAVRRIELDGVSLRAFRFRSRGPLDAAALGHWQEKGMRFLAVEHDGAVVPGVEAVPAGLAVDDEAIVVGPEGTIEAFRRALS